MSAPSLEAQRLSHLVGKHNRRASQYYAAERVVLNSYLRVFGLNKYPTLISRKVQ